MTELDNKTTPSTIESHSDMCMRPTYKCPNNDTLLAESHDNDILPIVELTTIDINDDQHPLIVHNEDVPITEFDEKDYDFYCDDKISQSLEKNLFFDEEKNELIKQEKYCDSEGDNYMLAYKDQKDEEDLWVLPESELKIKRSKLWTKPRIITTMAVLYMLCLGASYLYFYHDSSCM